MEMSEPSVEDMAAETLSGDLRDVMLTHIRSMETPWSKMSEAAQSDKIYAISNGAENLVRRAVAIIAAQGQEPMFGRIAKFTVKDEIKSELIAPSSVANIEKVAENIGQPCIVIFANPDQFIGQKAEAKPDKDQPELVDSDQESLSDDELYEKAVAAVRADSKASTSFIQRKFSIGYNRAAALMERMEGAGVVSPADNSGKRDVLAPSVTTDTDAAEMPEADPSSVEA